MSWFAPNLPRDKHCFFGSEGGVSEGFYKSLNLNLKSKDKPENIYRNMEIVAGYYHLPKTALHLLNQGVSAEVMFVDKPSQMAYWADGAVTDRSGIILSIRTADCAPVLLGDFENGVIGAAHAGWRGAFKGVIENTLDLMLAKGARRENIRAAVGPCIAQRSYEVDEGFYRQFTEKNSLFAAFFDNGVRSGFYQFDLEAFCLSRLKHYGIENICASGLDTYTLEDRFFSFRRFTHRGQVCEKSDFPVEISTITL